MEAHKKNSEEFGRIYETESKNVFQTALRYSNYDYDLAQDVTQDVFERYCLYFEPHENDNPVGWLNMTARNVTLNYIKKRSREIPEEDIVLAMDLHVVAQSAEDEVFQKIGWMETRNRAERIMDCLLEKNVRWYRAVAAVYCADRRQKDVASEMKTSPTVLTGVLQRARNWIRKQEMSNESDDES